MKNLRYIALGFCGIATGSLVLCIVGNFGAAPRPLTQDVFSLGVIAIVAAVLSAWV